MTEVELREEAQRVARTKIYDINPGILYDFGKVLKSKEEIRRRMFLLQDEIDERENELAMLSYALEYLVQMSNVLDRLGAKEDEDG